MGVEVPSINLVVIKEDADAAAKDTKTKADEAEAKQKDAKKAKEDE